METLKQKDIRTLSLPELKAEMETMGERSFRAKHIDR